MTAKYWTKTGKDMWVLSERTVFEFKNIETGEVVTCDVSDTKFVPVIMPEVKAKTPKVKKKTAKTVKSIGKSGSKYKGVRRDGKKFSGSYWDGKNKKAKYLGMFDSELQAAAAVQAALGNYKEAKRLLNEYEEGNGGPEASKPQVVHNRIFSEDE